MSDRPRRRERPGGPLPEVQALRIVLYPRGARALLLSLWACVSGLFVILMAYGSFRPLTSAELLLAGSFGGMIALSVGLGATARRYDRCDPGAVRPRGSAVVGSLLGAVATSVSCMCCLPVLPAILGAVLSGTAAAGGAYSFSLFLSHWSAPLYGLSAALLLLSIRAASRSLVSRVEARSGTSAPGTP